MVLAHTPKVPHDLNDLAEAVDPDIVPGEEGRLELDSYSFTGSFVAALISAARKLKKEVFFNDGGDIYGMTPTMADKIGPLAVRNITGVVTQIEIARAIASARDEELLKFFSSIQRTTA